MPASVMVVLAFLFLFGCLEIYIGLNLRGHRVYLRRVHEAHDRLSEWMAKYPLAYYPKSPDFMRLLIDLQKAYGELRQSPLYFMVQLHQASAIRSWFRSLAEYLAELTPPDDPPSGGSFRLVSSRHENRLLEREWHSCSA